MQEIILDKDFQLLLPVLNEEAFAGMEADLLENRTTPCFTYMTIVLKEGLKT